MLGKPTSSSMLVLKEHAKLVNLKFNASLYSFKGTC
jgi:hypothetical protein